jgi:hypothetical protein
MGVGTDAMLTTFALLPSCLVVALLADAMPTRALARAPSTGRARRALALVPLVAIVQYVGLATQVGAAAAIASLACAWMLAGWLYTLALEHRPRQVRAIGLGVGTVGLALTAGLVVGTSI